MSSLKDTKWEDRVTGDSTQEIKNKVDGVIIEERMVTLNGLYIFIWHSEKTILKSHRSEVHEVLRVRGNIVTYGSERMFPGLKKKFNERVIESKERKIRGLLFF